MRFPLRPLVTATLAALVLLPFARADQFEGRYQAIRDSQGKAPEAERLHALFKVDWEYHLADSPEEATQDGVTAYDTRWTDLSPAAVAERRRQVARALPVLATIDRSKLEPADRTSYDLFKRQGEEAAEEAKFPTELLAVNQLAGVQQEAAAILRLMPRATAADLENQVARLQALAPHIDQVIGLLQEGLRRGITPPQVTLREVPAQVLAQIPDDPFQSPLLEAFAEPAPTVGGEDSLRLRAAAAKAYVERVRPAFLRLHAFLVDHYLPGARTTIAATALPDGAAWYAHDVRVRTTTDLTADQIHALGLAEVKRIRAEMEAVKSQTGFKGTMAEFFTFLRTDPRFYYTNADDLIRGYRDIAKHVDPGLMRLFGTLPRTTYGVIPVPAYAEKSQTTAYYMPGAPDAGRPGYFYANTYALNTRPKWEMEALTLHEAVPGHHLQISLAQEMGDLPEFRRFGGYTAFVEGWGLYAESLGDELGLYTDPYMKFGQLTYEMWRAVRLVVDTGMHAKGWTRDQAIAFFKENAGKSEHDIEVEVDRYIVWPGQALAYKLGELKLKELRAYATKELGAKFDVRRFHDRVLRNGAVPLGYLDEDIRAWVADEKKRG
ncbi:MAG: DUF885 domain-containing protein [Verrucomicrobia bacterium]|nr:DUF885 domain-containing protein [Verrucomicrobiota bacterium]